MARRLTGRQLAQWSAFEKTFGPLTVQERVDAVTAATAWAPLAAAGALKDKDATPADFMPDWDPDAPKPEQTDEEMMAALGALRSIGGNAE